jgi:ribosomal protein S18 acetylase RimI-like enzyme
MTRRDLNEVLAIDRGRESPPWSEDRFLRVMSRRDVIGQVVELAGDRIGGFVVYRLRPRGLFVLRLAVDPEYRRHGVGRALVAKLVGKLHPGRRTRLVLDADEHLDGGHLFLRACGWEATRVIERATRSYYRFAYELQGPAAEEAPGRVGW